MFVLAIELALLNEFFFIWTKCCCVSFGPVVFDIFYTILNGAKIFTMTYYYSQSVLAGWQRRT